METKKKVQWINKQEFGGEVIHGMKIGRKLGFPTANVASSSPSLQNGVYGVQVHLNSKKYEGIMNIGFKPTIGSDLKHTIEIHLLNFEGDLYGQHLKCIPLFYIRAEQKFSSLHSLLKQIKEDKEYARVVFRSENIDQNKRIS
ncbi:riboflavin kinase [Priestia filamentosa]|uniref:riboflavin kinase n=1 Tax=Priestia filamentosa TaxID=1402861 RepID=UPI0002D75129|nr:riboflavin kinase [Priestia filamentosa]RJS66440.1 hypothetical protein CJ485_17745 [Priestia filamentosa]WCM15350.1 riboflavin kinase [Priestia filamentosa]